MMDRLLLPLCTDCGSTVLLPDVQLYFPLLSILTPPLPFPRPCLPFPLLQDSLRLQRQLTVKGTPLTLPGSIPTPDRHPLILPSHEGSVLKGMNILCSSLTRAIMDPPLIVSHYYYYYFYPSPVRTWASPILPGLTTLSTPLGPPSPVPFILLDAL